MTAARDQLLRLHEEFDIANAAPAQLDIVTAHRDGAMALELVDTAFHRVDIGHGGEVQIFPPNERQELLEKSLAKSGVAGRDPRLDKRRAFPILPVALVVDQPGLRRERDLRRAGVRPQPQIRSIDVAVLGLLLQQPDQIPRDLHEKGRRLDALGKTRPVQVVEHHEVDIGRVVQFPCPQLAHGDDEISVDFGRRHLPRLVRRTE
ncbi:MAG: hypothetical protein A49_15140 [Methyloceanibacter sp.]|nr:MAG: hypothetical protein A49_15140 [Methyloceanibacter sp.]